MSWVTNAVCMHVCVQNNNNGEDVQLDKEELQEAINQANLEASAEYKSESTLFLWSELRSCVKVKVAIGGSLSLMVLRVSVDVKQHWTWTQTHRAQELCESRGGHPGLPVPNSPYGLCGREAALNVNFLWCWPSFSSSWLRQPTSLVWRFYACWHSIWDDLAL